MTANFIRDDINFGLYMESTEAGHKLVNMLPRKRLGKPEDLDLVLLMLCANESHFVNGAVIQADDGFGL